MPSVDSIRRESHAAARDVLQPLPTQRHSCKARRSYSIFEPIVTVTARPDRRELTLDRRLVQSAVITGESGVAGRELLANQNIRNECVVISRKNIELTFTEHSRIF